MNWDTGCHPTGEPNGVVVNCLRGMMRYPEAVEFARTMPPERWPGGFPRAMAAAIIVGDKWPLERPDAFPWLTGLEQQGGNPLDAKSAVRFLKVLSLYGLWRESARARERHAEAKKKWDRAAIKCDRLRVKSWGLLGKARSLELQAEELRDELRTVPQEVAIA